MRIRLAFLLGACALVAGVARASDGVFEINQACAAVGCFPGDTPGFSVTLGAPGSYRLTSNLTVAATNVNAILVSGTQIQVDLGGFAVSGPNTCAGDGASIVCSGGGTSTGITSSNPPFRVRNGSVRGFGGGGVLTAGGEAELLRVEENGNFGVFGSAVDVVARRNAGVGITVSQGIVRNCVVTLNAANGINAFTSRVVDNVVVDNGAVGISAPGSVVSENVLRTNGMQGIVSTGVIRNNLVEYSGADGIVGSGGVIVGNSSVSNGQAGIAALTAASILDNIVRSNVGVGIYMFPEGGGPAATYRGNVITTAGPQTTVVSGVNMGGNTCNGSATCP